MSKITLTSLDASNAYASLRPQVEGIGAQVSAADKTLADARKALANLLPLALSFAMLSRLTGASAKDDSKHLGIRPDMFAIYAIAGALVVHGVTPEQARADVVAAVNVSKASKPALWEAACESLAAFRKEVKAADARRAESEDTEPEQTEPEQTDGSTGSDEVLGEAVVDPAEQVAEAVKAWSRDTRAMAKGFHEDDSLAALVTEEQKRSMIRAYSALAKSLDLAATLAGMAEEAKAKRAQAQVGAA